MSEVSDEKRQRIQAAIHQARWAHIATLVGGLLGIVGALVPTVFLLSDRSNKAKAKEAKKGINFIITINLILFGLLAVAAVALLAIEGVEPADGSSSALSSAFSVVFGVLLLALAVGLVVTPIRAFLRARQGKRTSYPFSLPIFK